MDAQAAREGKIDKPRVIERDGHTIVILPQRIVERHEAAGRMPRYRPPVVDSKPPVVDSDLVDTDAVDSGSVDRKAYKREWMRKQRAATKA